ncbi:MAG: IS66 family transposase [Planctomycetia bacterium]|nr:IS66 family transposase [Planctomycetia bacterium]
MKARLNNDSTNSSLPSSTHPHAKPAPPKPKSKKRRGGQHGHPKAQRTLIPTDQCQAIVPCIPSQCRRCGQTLRGTDSQPLRHQVWELPEIQPVVTEYQQHQLKCDCGCSTCGVLPEGAPTGQAGPRLTAFAGLLMACFRQSKRRAAQFLSTILNQPASAAWMVLLQNRCADAVQPAHDELATKLAQQSILHIDESPTKEGSSKAWIWTFVADSFTVFACRNNRRADILDELLGENFAGVIHCDRAKMYWQFGQLQWCWAHLQRDFQALLDHPCPVRQQLGHLLMPPTKKLFTLWKRVRDGTLSRVEFVRRMQAVKFGINRLLLWGYLRSPTTSFCRELLRHCSNLWTFLSVDGVEPTNNAAERALRHAVIWRKLSFGTQSASGSRFVERMLTVIETCRRAGRNVFAWLTQTVRAHFHREAAPPLLAAA